MHQPTAGHEIPLSSITGAPALLGSGRTVHRRPSQASTAGVAPATSQTAMHQLEVAHEILLSSPYAPARTGGDGIRRTRRPSQRTASGRRAAVQPTATHERAVGHATAPSELSRSSAGPRSTAHARPFQRSTPPPPAEPTARHSCAPAHDTPDGVFGGLGAASMTHPTCVKPPHPATSTATAAASANRTRVLKLRQYVRARDHHDAGNGSGRDREPGAAPLAQSHQGKWRPHRVALPRLQTRNSRCPPVALPLL